MNAAVRGLVTLDGDDDTPLSDWHHTCAPWIRRRRFDWRLAVAGTRFIRFEDMEPEQARRMRDLIARAERAREPASVKARRERNARHPVRYAVADERLPDGAVAAVVRDPHSVPARLVVISRDADDLALYLADAARDRDEAAIASPHGRRLVLVMADQRLIIKSEIGSEAGTLDLLIPNPPGRELTALLLRAAAGGHAIRIAGIGL